MMTPRYSTRPMQDYILTALDSCDVRLIQAEERAPQIWNLFWLSTPGVDDGNYTANPSGLAALIRDVNEDEVLYRKLDMPPLEFLAWWRREDVSVFDAFYEYGEETWKATVLARASQSLHRMREADAVIGQASNVYTVSFGRRTA